MSILGRIPAGTSGRGPWWGSAEYGRLTDDIKRNLRDARRMAFEARHNAREARRLGLGGDAVGAGYCAERAADALRWLARYRLDMKRAIFTRRTGIPPEMMHMAIGRTT